MSDDGRPRDARIPEAKRQIFDELTDSSDSPFNGWESNELFVFAAAYGFDQGLRTELDDSGHALFQWPQLDDSQDWILRSIAVKEEANPDVLDDGQAIDLISREYANGGIERLYELYVGTGDLFTKLTDDVMDLADI
jgi:dnd system-associated protein 4